MLTILQNMQPATGSGVLLRKRPNSASQKGPLYLFGLLPRLCVDCVLAENIAFPLLLSLSACATPPRHVNNVCAVFDQRNGWFNNWQQAAYRVSAKYDIPVPILMARIRKESGFNADARPPRKYLLGLIPWGYVSTANGFRRHLMEPGISIGARRAT